MAKSQNGWFVALESDLRKWIVPSTGRHLVLRDGSAGFLLVYLAVMFHRTVERLNITGQEWDEWGYANRPVRGSGTTISNHASGTAEDLNATLHPLGVPITRTFTAKQIRRIRRILRWPLMNTLAWGGEWSRPDGMHFELRVPLARAERVARLLIYTPIGRRIIKANPGARKVIFS